MVIYWIDDDLAYREVINLYHAMCQGPQVITLSSWAELKKYTLKTGDIVIHDINGVGEPIPKVEGVIYYSHSGGDKSDIPKPMCPDTIFKKVLGL